MARLSAQAAPETIARAAERLGCASVAYTYNDPVIFMEYALDAAAACRARGVKNVAVTAGFICAEPRKRFFAGMDAANVDLKGFTERFYAKLCAGSLAPVLDTLKYLVHETNVWTEITTLIIPGENDSDAELDALTQWVARELRQDVPLHFTAFHPDYRMRETEPTPPPTLQRARAIAIRNGLHHVYIGNVHDSVRQATLCPTCGAHAISRDGYTITAYALDVSGACASCGTKMAGVFAQKPGAWGARRVAVDIERYAGVKTRWRERARSAPKPFRHRLDRFDIALRVASGLRRLDRIFDVAFRFAR